MSERTNDPERIYLEPPPYSPEGRLWCADDVWPLDGDGPGGVEYIRADLAAPEPGGEGETLESRAYEIAHWIATEARVAESLDRSVAPIESEGARRIVALASARPTPADVRELAVEIVRSLDLIARNYDSYEYGLPVLTHYDEMVDTVLTLLRTPRGEGETMDADEMWFHWSSGHESAALLGLRTASDDEAHRFLSMLADWQRCPMPSDHDVAAALRSEAQGEEDAVRRTWEQAVQRAYGCLDYCGGYRGAELEAFHSGIKTVIRALEAGPDTVDTQTAALDRIGAALRTEAQGEGWQVTEPARDIVRREMPETRATVREAIRAARRGEGGGE